MDWKVKKPSNPFTGRKIEIMALSGRVKPVAAAKELGIRPQIVYGWLKSGKLKVYPGDHVCKQYVDMTEVRGMHNKSASKGPREDRGTRTRKEKDSTGKWEDKGFASPINRGDVVSYGSKRTKTLIQARNDDAYFTQFKNTKREDEEFQNTSIADNLKQGVFKIEPLEGLVNMVLFQLCEQFETVDVAGFVEWMNKASIVIDQDLNSDLLKARLEDAKPAPDEPLEIAADSPAVLDLIRHLQAPASTK